MRNESKDRVKRAIEAWRAITGRPPTETPDAWKVFFEAAMAVAEPTPARDEWVKACTNKWRATPGLLKSRVRPALEALRAPDDSEPRSPAAIRSVLGTFDPKCAALTDEQIQRAMKRRGWYARIAALALPVGAFGVQRRKGELEDEALKRIARAFTEASSVRKRK